jgi:hypothetical protein
VSIELSCVVLACVMEITRLYSAFFVPPVALDNYPNWKFFDAISYMKYGYVGLVINEYEGWIIPCKTKELVTFNGVPKTCRTGDQYMETFGYDRYTIEFCEFFYCTVVSIFMHFHFAMFT